MTQQSVEAEARLRDVTTTPTFVYDCAVLLDRARQLTQLKAPYGLTVRYAIKANPRPEIIELFAQQGIDFDASSSYEAEQLLAVGISGERISLSSQQPADNLDVLLKANVKYVATSLHQLRLFCQSPNRSQTVGVRLNPGIGAGHNNRTTTGGANSSFGLWNAYTNDALAVAREAGVQIDRLHVHIGSGADPTMWGRVMGVALELVDQLPDVTSLDIGGGFKVHRYGDEQEADMEKILMVFSEKLRHYQQKTNRALRLEIEPGTWLVAHGGTLVAKVVDIVDTGRDGHTFLRLNTGMNDITRPSMYGARHTIAVLNQANDTADYVVVGHNCETGDILTPAEGDPEALETRTLARATIGDRVAIYDVGAYCQSMSVKGYNSFPDAATVFVNQA